MRGMIIRRFAFALVPTTALCTCAAAAPARSGDFLIVPGQRIGRTLLGSQGSRMLSHLPTPTRSDGGMSQQYLVWLSSASRRGRRDTLFIHTVRNGELTVKPLDGVTIDVIRVTSPVFATQSGLHVGSPLAQIQHQFPHLRSANRFTNPSHTLYDDKSRGIAFEFAHP
ncbi:MAG: hypothetical protein M3Y13_13685, partial [Armatimonadota bacterium]|nr:hypothetical protein [Armatimonadota bacterium]